MGTYLAIDIGGTKLAVGVVDDDGRALVRTERPTDRTDPWPGVAALVTATLEGGAAPAVRSRSAWVAAGR